MFTCVVAGFPAPRENEIRLVAPAGKQVTLIQSSEVDGYLYRRSSLFLVSLGIVLCLFPQLCICYVLFNTKDMLTDHLCRYVGLNLSLLGPT